VVEAKAAATIVHETDFWFAGRMEAERGLTANANVS
jgi:hypothetical protein